jgi:hypothetical protein
LRGATTGLTKVGRVGTKEVVPFWLKVILTG